MHDLNLPTETWDEQAVRGYELNAWCVCTRKCWFLQRYLTMEPHSPYVELGRLIHNSGYMILKQVEHYLDEARRLELARRFVQGALTNLAQVARYYHQRQTPLEEILQSLKTLTDTTLECDSIETLMQVEGKARETYYTLFDRVLQNPDFAFEKRTRCPPRNRLNALLSFGICKKSSIPKRIASSFICCVLQPIWSVARWAYPKTSRPSSSNFGQSRRIRQTLKHHHRPLRACASHFFR